ncbi:MAG: hypothetical protein K8L99_33850 [Anaerolineae bacterium]|nr:hypothetical protein [Anaerolineae bacterium]
MVKRLLLIIALLALVVIVLVSRQSQLQECPDYEIGTLVYLNTDDVFDGRMAEVFAEGWSTIRGDVYIVRLSEEGGGYIAATGCELSPDM